jgi:lipid kinase YegS
MSRFLHLIVHPKRAADAELTAAVAALRKAGHRVEESIPDERGASERLARRAAESGAEVVVAVGGDGTLNEVVNGLIGTDAACAAVPAGTANDFATSAGIPLGDVAAALGLAAAGAPRPIDLGRVNGRAFLNVASGGFVTELTASTPEPLKKLLGGVSYLLTGLAKVGSVHAKPVRLSGPGLDWTGDAYVLAVGNGRQAGGGFKLCDRATLDDGLLDIVLIADLPFDQVIALMGELATGRPAAESDRVTYHQVPDLEVAADDGLQFNLDGEPLRGERFRFEAVPRALRFVLPAGSPLLGA